MNMKSVLRHTLLAALVAGGVAGCASTPSNVYSAGRTMTAAEVQYGTIVSARPVELRRLGQADQYLGAALGTVAGAALGNQIGGGSGKVLATGAGAVGGAYGGMRVGQALGRSSSTEWFVRLDNMRTIAVVQDDRNLHVGQRVAVIQDGASTRLVP